MSTQIGIRIIGALLLALSFVGFANAYSPVRKRDLTIAFDILRDFPDYDFYLKYGYRENGGYRSFHLKLIEHDPIRFTLKEKQISELNEFYLLAVPHGKDIAAPAGEGHTDQWIRFVPEGMLQVGPLLTREGLTFPQNSRPIRFTVSISNGKLNAEHINWHTWETITTEIIWLSPLLLFAVVVLGLVIRAWQNNRRARLAGSDG